MAISHFINLHHLLFKLLIVLIFFADLTDHTICVGLCLPRGLSVIVLIENWLIKSVCDIQLLLMTVIYCFNDQL